MPYRVKPMENFVVPWDPICTPFSLAELRRLCLVHKRYLGGYWSPLVSPNWRHPDDPLMRIVRYNFWDVLQESLNVFMIASGHYPHRSHEISASMTDWISHTLDFIISSHDGCSAIDLPKSIGGVVIYILKDFKSHGWPTAGEYLQPFFESVSGMEDFVVPLVGEGQSLVFRVERMLRAPLTGC